MIACFAALISRDESRDRLPGGANHNPPPSSFDLCYIDTSLASKSNLKRKVVEIPVAPNPFSLLRSYRNYVVRRRTLGKEVREGPDLRLGISEHEV